MINPAYLSGQVRESGAGCREGAGTAIGRSIGMWIGEEVVAHVLARKVNWRRVELRTVAGLSGKPVANTSTLALPFKVDRHKAR